jgi:hypothetical protein
MAFPLDRNNVVQLYLEPTDPQETTSPHADESEDILPIETVKNMFSTFSQEDRSKIQQRLLAMRRQIDALVQQV